MFISLKYHATNPNYLKERIKKLGNLYVLRVILCKVDTDNPDQHLLEMNQLCFFGDFTLILGWSDLECARYIETYKLYEKKDSKLIQPKVDNDYTTRIQDTLTSVQSVSKPDALNLISNFGVISHFNFIEYEKYLKFFGKRVVCL